MAISCSLRGGCWRIYQGRQRGRGRGRRDLCCSLAPCSRACVSRAWISAQVCLVTASTAGIGLGIARRLGREGASVMVRINVRRMCVSVCVRACTCLCVCVCVGGRGYTHVMCMCVYVRLCVSLCEAFVGCVPRAAQLFWCVSRTLTRVCFLTRARMHASAR